MRRNGTDSGCILYTIDALVLRRLVELLRSQLTAMNKETSQAHSELEIGQEHFLKECERLKSAHQNEMSAVEQKLDQLV